MADTENTAAAVSNPTEDTKAQSSAVKPDSQADAATDFKTQDKATKDDAGEEKWELNGKSEGRAERRDNGNDRNDRNGRNDRRDGGRGRGRGRGRGGFQNNHKRRNNEFNDLPETDDPEQIRAQVEFYFSTHNLCTDEHMFMELDGPNNRPVSIKHITSFKRMRRFQPYSAVVKALRESKDLELVEHNGEEAVKRKEPLLIPAKEGDDENKPSTTELFYRLKNASSNNMETSAYVKGFGDEGEVGQITLEQFFRPYGSVMVRKRRDDDNSWKGSVFVEFDTEESQKQFLALDPKPKFNDNELTTMGKKEYILLKCEEKGIKPDWELTEEEKKEKRREHFTASRGRDSGRGRGGPRGRGRGGRGGRGGGRDGGRDRRRDRSASGESVDSRDWNARRDRYQKGKDDRGSRRDDKKEPKEVEKDAYGVPLVKDSRTDAEIAASNKRKADDADREASPKKSKLEIKEDA